MKKISPQSKSFFILFLLALVGTYASLLLSQRLVLKGQYNEFAAPGRGDYRTITYNSEPTPSPTPPPKSATTTLPGTSVDTSNWKTYTNTRYNFSFQYPPTWQVKNLGIKDLYYQIEILLPKNQGTMKVYVNHLGFFAMEALPTTQETIAGETATNVKDELYGIAHNGVYFTFDLNTATNNQSEFVALVHTLAFQ